jgi:hypothetical protein
VRVTSTEYTFRSFTRWRRVVMDYSFGDHSFGIAKPAGMGLDTAAIAVGNTLSQRAASSVAGLRH